MADDFTKIGDLELKLTSGFGYNVTKHDFPEPRKRIDTQGFIQGNGGNIVSALYENSNRGLEMDITGANKEDLLTNIAVLQDELKKLDRGEALPLEYKAADADNTNFSDLLEYDRRMLADWQFVNTNLAKMRLAMPADPFWRGDFILSAVQSLLSPGILSISNVKGDVETPLSIFFDARDGSYDLNSKYWAGSRFGSTGRFLYDQIGTVDASRHNGLLRRTSLADSELVLSSIPGGAGLPEVDDEKGKYRMIRLARTADGSPTDVSVRARTQLNTASANIYTWNAAINPFTAADTWTWFDAGEINIPNADLPSTVDESTLSAAIWLYGTGSSAAAANFDLDLFILIPVNNGAVFAQGTLDDSDNFILFDSQENKIYEAETAAALSAAAIWPGTSNPVWSAVFQPMMVQPGANQIPFASFPTVDTFGTVFFQTGYFPRYLSPVRT